MAPKGFGFHSGVRTVSLDIVKLLNLNKIQVSYSPFQHEGTGGMVDSLKPGEGAVLRCSRTFLAYNQAPLGSGIRKVGTREEKLAFWYSWCCFLNFCLSGCSCSRVEMLLQESRTWTGSDSGNVPPSGPLSALVC